MLTLHLPVDAVHVLGPAIHLGTDSGLAHLRLQTRAELLDIALTIGAAFIEGGCDVSIFIRIEVSEREVFELPLQLPHTESIGQRRKYRPSFYCQSLTLLRWQCARVPEFDQLLGQTCEHEAWITHYR